MAGLNKDIHCRMSEITKLDTRHQMDDVFLLTTEEKFS